MFGYLEFNPQHTMTSKIEKIDIKGLSDHFEIRRDELIADKINEIIDTLQGEKCGELIPLKNHEGRFEECQNPKGQCPIHDKCNCGALYATHGEYQSGFCRPQPTPTATEGSVDVELLKLDFENRFKSLLNTIKPIENFQPSNEMEEGIKMAYHYFVPSIFIQISTLLAQTKEAERARVREIVKGKKRIMWNDEPVQHGLNIQNNKTLEDLLDELK